MLVLFGVCMALVIVITFLNIETILLLPSRGGGKTGSKAILWDKQKSSTEDRFGRKILVSLHYNIKPSISYKSYLKLSMKTILEQL